MTSEWRAPIVGGAVLLILLALGLFGLERSTAPQGRFLDTRPTLPAPQPPWASSLREADAALGQGDLARAERALRDAYGAALGSRRWDGMLEIGDAYQRLAVRSRSRQNSIARARQSYLTALFRARQQRSLEGVLRAAEAFAGLGDREVADRCLGIGARLAADVRDPRAVAQVHALAERLDSRVIGLATTDPF